MNTEELATAIQLCAPAVVTSNYIPVLSHFCFSKDSMYAYDDVSAIIVKLETDLNCALRAGPLSQLVGFCGAQVKFKPNGEGVLMTSGRSKFNLPMLGPKEFVYHEPEEDWTLELDLTPDFRAGLAMCTQSVSKDPLLHKEWTAVAVRSGPSGTVLHAFDGIGLIRYSSDVKGAKKDRSFLLPQSVCTQIGTLCARLLENSEDKATLHVGKNYVQLTFKEAKPEVRLVGKLLPEKAPDHEGLIEGLKLSSKPFAIPKGFHAAVAKVAVVVAGETEPRCTIEVDGEQMIVRGEGQLGSSETVLDLAKPVKKASATLDPDRLSRYEDRLERMAVDSGSIAMHGPGVDYYTAAMLD